MTDYVSAWHDPVLVDDVLAFLDVRPGRRFIDGTLGGGGHTHAILDASQPDGEVLAIDRDPAAIDFARERLADYGDRVQLAQGNYADADKLAADFGPVDGFLVDAGVSSRQLDDAERGFSFRGNGPLDMRMGPDAPTLEQFLQSIDEKELARVFRKYGEMKDAGRIAARVLEAFQAGSIETTGELAALIEREGGSAGRKSSIHPATLAFQALRIAVNDELTGLDRAVQNLPRLLAAGGRAVFISFHSLEDRIVKRGFRDLCSTDVPHGVPMRAADMQAAARLLTTKPVTASDEELSRNPRSRSAKLRAIEML